jgi:hypothetical protein
MSDSLMIEMPGQHISSNSHGSVKMHRNEEYDDEITEQESGGCKMDDFQGDQMKETGDFDDDDFDNDEEDVYWIEDEDDFYEATGDFTKRYNRLRQQVEAATATSAQPRPAQPMATAQRPDSKMDANNAEAKEIMKKEKQRWHDSAVEALASKFADRIYLGSVGDVSSIAQRHQGRSLTVTSGQLSNNVMNSIKASSRKAEGNRYVEALSSFPAIKCFVNIFTESFPL